MTILDGNSIADQLRQIVGEKYFSSDGLAPYALDGLTPRWVVSPGSPEQISSILSLANREGLAVLPRGNGTKFALAGLPRAADLVMSLNRFNRIVDYDAPNLTVTVEAGVTLSELKRVVAVQGNLIPLDPPFANATLGGIIATNGSGPKRLAYGSARDIVLGMRAVLPTGAQVRFGGKVVKNVAGYDMTRLLIGSWGTLGVITEMTFRLLPRPEAESSVLAIFPSLDQASGASGALFASQLLPSAVELVNGAGYKYVEVEAESIGLAGDYILAIDFEGFDEAVKRQVRDVTALCSKEGAKEVISVEGDRQERLWSALTDFHRGVSANNSAVVGLKSSVPISQVHGLIALSEKTAAQNGLECALIAHAGSGIIYTFFRVVSGNTQTLVQVIRDVQFAAEKAGGEAVVEWAPTEFKKQVPVWGEPQPSWSLMRRLKAEFDPKGILNPGRFVGGI